MPVFLLQIGLALYTLISRANYVIKYIPNVFSHADVEGQRYMAEAKALRALAYFYSPISKIGFHSRLQLRIASH